MKTRLGSSSYLLKMCYLTSDVTQCMNHGSMIPHMYIVDMLLTVQHHLPCMSRYSTMPLTVHF